ncbi:MAG TPA: hypothetical protein VFC94_06685 [Bacteroidaceae bacterium]|nr:hypothetical protein [Bacteroidaceae bacterium]
MSKTMRFALFSAGILLLASCKSSLGEISPDSINVTPQILEAVNGKVPATINGTFPAKYFHKKAVLTVTPVLQWEGGSVKGESITLQGESIEGNNQVVAKDAGGTYKLNASFDYQPEMAKSELYLFFDATVKGKEVSVSPVKIADGVISTSQLYSNTAAKAFTAPSEDAFQRVIKQATEANIMFVIQQANIRSSELKSDAINTLKESMKSVAGDTKNFGVENVKVSAYASPDGAIDLNERLASQREKNAKSYIQKEMKASKLDAALDTKYTAEDWDGFKTLVEKSDLQDKDLILRILSMYTDPERREAEIKNLSSVYKELAEDILPQLRRARLTLNYQIIGRSDDEIKEAYKSDPNTLSLEELLYCATLANNDAEKRAIYTNISNIFPNDYRAFNNLGELAFKEGDFALAGTNYNKAFRINSSAPEVNTNLGLLALAQGKPAEAETYLSKGGDSSANKEALGNLYIAQGQYDRALSSLRGSNTDSEALALIMTKDYTGATKTLSSIATPSGYTYYLNAIVAARTNDSAAVAQNLKKAVAADSSLRAKALEDIEFAKYQSEVVSL